LAIGDVMQSIEMQRTLAQFSAQVRPGTPEDFASFIATERAKWSAVIKDANIRIEGASK
jgi:tripartite-type tricarboxylate transporter receptor subunit TctC